MTMTLLRRWFLLAASQTALAGALTAGQTPVKSLLDVAAAGAEQRLLPTSAQVTVARSTDPTAPGLVVAIQPGPEGYPGVNLHPVEAKAWDLSQFGHVTARAVNMGAKTLSLALRVDDGGDWHESPWNTESVSIKPGATGTVTVIFGYTYGLKPGHALKSADVVNVMFFALKSTVPQSFRIESVEAGGAGGEKPPVDPKSVRVKPKNGAIFSTGVTFDPTAQLDAKGGAKAALENGKLKVELAAGKGVSTVTLKPEIGRWDLRDCLEVRVKVQNAGTTPCTPFLSVTSNGGPADRAAAAAPLAPGAETELVASFIPTAPWQGIKDSVKTEWNGTPATGTKFTSDAVSGVTVGADGAATLLVAAVLADMPPPPALPDWLGKRPPVPGDWVQTFAEEFDGASIDTNRWNLYTANYWDKRSHFSKDNVILGGGVAKLRYEKKTGFHNDNPSNNATAYASGFLDSYGKWVQRYGYFEARMKLPTAPGLWPAFWLMPDRGVALGPQWKRADTGNGGMEFDILEFLSRWGICRYNIAMHWDGYGKGHQQTGNACNYVQPDKDGFVTSGLLWTPGSAIFYCNGREIARWESPRISNVPSYPILNYVSGGWDNDGLDDKQLPADFVVDYVRIWQRADLASPADSPKSLAPAK